MTRRWALHGKIDNKPGDSWIWGAQTIEGIGLELPSDWAGGHVSGGYVTPLLCDTHTHGAMGLGVTADAANLVTLLDLLKGRGVGSVQLSTVTLPVAEIHRILNAAREVQSHRSELVGIHLEGPFLSREKKGAHDEGLLQVGSLAAVQGLIEPYLDIVTAITVDPLSVEKEAISWLAANGVRVAVGHTPATYSQALDAFDAGATVLTHAFNAMLPIGSREPGPVLAAKDAGAWIEVIADGHHVHPALVASLFDLAPERIILVTDSMSSAGLPDGEYHVGSVPVTMTNGIARTHEGSLAGSTVTLTNAVNNVVSWGVSPEQAMRAATVNPSLAYGFSQPTLAVGEPANILVWSADGEPTHLLLSGSLEQFA